VGCHQETGANAVAAVISVFGLDDCPLDLRFYWQSPGVAGKGSTCRSPEAVTNS
jgi:hypothetical protein